MTRRKTMRFVIDLHDVNADPHTRQGALYLEAVKNEFLFTARELKEHSGWRSMEISSELFEEELVADHDEELAYRIRWKRVNPITREVEA